MYREMRIRVDWSADMCDESDGGDDESGDVREEDTNCTDVVGCTDPSSSGGIVMTIALALVGKKPRRPECPFDGPDPGVPGLEVNGKSGILANDEASGS